MQPGPRPVPTELKRLAGNPGKRRLNENEPKPDLITEETPILCPEYLDGEAAAEWDRIIPILRRMRVLTEADLSMVANWCMLHGVLISAYADFKKTGTLTKNKRTGSITQNPLLGVVTRTIVEMKAIATEFGLTPSSRVRLATEPEDRNKGNKFAALG